MLAEHTAVVHSFRGRLFGIVKKIEGCEWQASSWKLGVLDFLKDTAVNVSTASYFPGVVMQVFTWNNEIHDSKYTLLACFVSAGKG